MRHRLTDYDYAVLAAARIGALKHQGQVWFMAGINCMASLFRLEQAGELYISRRGDILLHGTDEYRKAEDHQELITVLRRGIRNGTIKIEKPKKGPKP